jgi:release factor glutamine methyltransferase
MDDFLKDGIYSVKGSREIIDYGKIKVAVYSKVYRPSDDTFLLAEAVKKYGKVIELGSGSGYITAALVAEGNHVIAVDVSPYAVKSTEETVRLNQDTISYGVDIIQADGLTAVRGCRCFDAIYVNPPYLPVAEYQDWEGVAWSGGEEGIEVFLKMIDAIEDVLKPCGELYFIHSSLSNIDKAAKALEERGFKVSKVKTVHRFMEDIMLFKASKCA